MLNDLFLDFDKMIQLTTLRVQKKTTKGYLLIIVFSHTILINYLYINTFCLCFCAF